jgi:hypothetical protein
VSKHPFLSDEWFAIVEHLVEEHGAAVPAPDMMVNLVVTGTPFGEERHLHLGAREGTITWGIGHDAGPDLTITTDYDTAKHVVISGDAQAGMQAFMAGKVKIQGDFTKLMAAGGSLPGGSGALHEAIQGITE